MKKTERMLSAVLTMVVGVLLIVMKDNFIGVLASVIGMGLISFGIMDIVNGNLPIGIIKISCGVLVIICGWLIVSAVLYILALLTLTAGGWLFYEKIKNRVCGFWLYLLCEYAPSVLCMAIGLLLLFHAIISTGFLFITCGLLALSCGGVLLFVCLNEGN